MPRRTTKNLETEKETTKPRVAKKVKPAAAKRKKVSVKKITQKKVVEEIPSIVLESKTEEVISQTPVTQVVVDDSLFTEMGSTPLPPETLLTRFTFWCAERQKILTAIAVLVVSVGSVGFLGWHYGLAWESPPAPPPLGGPPGLIWNSWDSGAKKLLDTIQEAAITISKGAKIGGNLEVTSKTFLNAGADVTGDLKVTGGVQMDGTTMVIDKGANSVGINVASPTKTLDVNGDVLANGLCLFKGGTRTSGGTADCKGAWSEVAGAASGLSQVLNTGSDASAFTGTTKIGGPVDLGVLAVNGQLSLGTTDIASIGRIFVGRSDASTSELQIWNQKSGSKVNMKVDGNFAAGGNSVDSNWSITTPSLVVKGASSGTTIKDGQIVTDSGLTLKGWGSPELKIGGETDVNPTLFIKPTNTTGANISSVSINGKLYTTQGLHLTGGQIIWAGNSVSDPVARMYVGNSTSDPANLEILSNKAGGKANLKVAGNVTGNGLCIGTDCKTSWPVTSATPATPSLLQVLRDGGADAGAFTGQTSLGGGAECQWWYSWSKCKWKEFIFKRICSTNFVGLWHN